jgi:hypothetical protein
MTFNRTIVAARQTLPDTLAKEFLPLEQCADATAVKTFRFLALTLEQRAGAGLPATAGETAIDLLYSACRQAYEVQSQLRRAHAMWPAIATEMGFIAPECDPKGLSGALPLKVVA